MVKNDICAGGASKHNTFFPENVPLKKNAPMPSMFRIGPDDSILLKAFSLKLTETLNASMFVSSFLHFA